MTIVAQVNDVTHGPLVFAGNGRFYTDKPHHSLCLHPKVYIEIEINEIF